MFKSFSILLIVVLSINEAVLPGCTTCPPNGQWSAWKDFTSCSKTCGFFGKKIQKRTCASWGYGCGCKGVYSRIVPCPGSRCPTSPFCSTGHTVLPKQCKPITRADDYVKPNCSWNKKLDLCPCPFGGIWSSWSNSAVPCTASCGLCGTITQTRTCTSGPHGCPCIGPVSRKVTCPQAPCPNPPKCCHGEPMIKNLEANANKCFQLPADPLLTPVPACLTTDCAKCTMTSPLIEIDTTTSNKTIPFSKDILNQNAQGCVVRVMECPSEIAGLGARIQYDYDSSKFATSERFGVRAVLTCNSTGNGWEFTSSIREGEYIGNKTTVDHVAQCFGPTCNNTNLC